jgi:hypothetical protein
MSLTVGQIAEQLIALAPDAAETRERIRHWTREDLLSPVASHHSGTGRHRKYDASSVYDAAILNAVAQAGPWAATHGRSGRRTNQGTAFSLKFRIGRWEATPR